MAKELLPDELWAETQPLLPVHVPSPKGGRPPADDRDCLVGIVFLLRSGITWQMLPTAAFGQCRRIKLCYERDGMHFQAFHELAAILICFRRLKQYTAGF